MAGMTEALLYEQLPDAFVACQLCAHRCRIAPAKLGLCGVRENIEGRLYTLAYGEVVAAGSDPIEKKPLYHFLPGSFSYSIAARGCNFRCGFCQNWQISQNPQQKIRSKGYRLSPAEIVTKAKTSGCKSIAYTYTEPTIFFEYAYETAQRAKKEGLDNVFVTNGYMTKQSLEMINPYLDAANVDLKSFREEFYVKFCGGHLKPVLESIRLMKKLGIWVEVTTLIIPGENDSAEELNDLARFIAELGQDIPWHISRFYPQYRFNEYPPTGIEVLRKAREIGRNKELRYVYLGNVAEGSDTFCYQCDKLLVRRNHFSIDEYAVKQGKCFYCGAAIDGRWQDMTGRG